MRLTVHIIATTNKDDYTIRQIGVPMTVTNTLAERPWTYRQIKINLDPDISLHVFKWKLIWDSDLPTSNQEGAEIPYVVRKMTSREGITPMPTGPAVMLWLEQISNSLGLPLLRPINRFATWGCGRVTMSSLHHVW